MSDRTQDEVFKEESGISVCFIDIYVEEDRKFIRMEDDAYYFKLDMADAIAFRDFLNKVIP